MNIGHYDEMEKVNIIDEVDKAEGVNKARTTNAALARFRRPLYHTTIANIYHKGHYLAGDEPARKENNDG